MIEITTYTQGNNHIDHKVTKQELAMRLVTLAKYAVANKGFMAQNTIRGVTWVEAFCPASDHKNIAVRH